MDANANKHLQDELTLADLQSQSIPLTNGHSNGLANGHSNGLANGVSNGHAEDHCGRRENESDEMPFLMIFLRRRLHLLPIITAGFIMTSFLTSYIVAVSYGHAEPDFPYISHTAIEAPERSIFAQMINIGAFMLALNVGVRLLQMSAVLTHLQAERRDHLINKASAVIGVLSAFGLTVVANFQTKSETRAIHYIGAGISFICGTCYCWMQTAISLRYRHNGCVTVAQLANSIVLTVCFVAFAISKTIYRVRESQGDGTKYDSLRAVYLVSTITEWLTAISIVTFAITFYRDFQAVQLILPKVKIIGRDHVDSVYRSLRRPAPGRQQPDYISSVYDPEAAIN